MTGIEWLRGVGVREGEERAKALYESSIQRARDISLLCDALEGFYDHPNTDAEDRRMLDEALERLFWPVVQQQTKDTAKGGGPG
jgi:hypothetical protein